MCLMIEMLDFVFFSSFIVFFCFRWWYMVVESLVFRFVVGKCYLLVLVFWFKVLFWYFRDGLIRF